MNPKTIANSTTHRRKESHARKILLVLIILIFIALLPSKLSYDREATLMERLYERGGCVFDNCPQMFKDRLVKEHNGLLPPNHYANDTKLYIRSLCTYSPSICKS